MSQWKFNPDADRDAKKTSPDAAETLGDDTAEIAAAAPAEGDRVAELTAAFETLRKEKEELWNNFLRQKADFENVRKRLQRERIEETSRATAAVIESLLPALDGFERAFAAESSGAHEETVRGFELIYRQLWDALVRHGLVRIEAAGRAFDPHLHQAVERVETTELPDHTVISEVRAGYMLRDRVLRPAMVRVAVAPAGAMTESSSIN